MDHSKLSRVEPTHQSISSPGDHADILSQVPPPLDDFDFAAFMAIPLPGETGGAAGYGTFAQPDQHPQALEEDGWYGDSSQAPQPPHIEYHLDEPASANAAVANDWLDHVGREGYGSSSVPINISAPADQEHCNSLLGDASTHIYASSAPITRPASAAAISRNHLAPYPAAELFLNPISNNFTSPGTPLSVIDSHLYPFEAELQAALQAELDEQNEVERTRDLVVALETELNRRKQSEEGLLARLETAKALLPVPPTPAPTPYASSGVKTPRNKRKLNIASTDPTQHYHPPAQTPVSWGTVAFDTGEHVFRYTKYGDLDPKRAFEAEQIVEFLSQHPLPNGTLTLWIQTVPADSAGRYPSKNSDKCRFSNCPDALRTIRKGDFRVALDEDSANAQRDPFHVAAFVHLYCLEKNFDFPQICKDFDVRPDERVLPEGKNKMAITRDHRSMGDIVARFVEASTPWAAVDGGRPAQYYAQTLCYQLTKEHLEKQPRHLQRIREERGGNTIDIHMNNLDVYVEGQRARREQQVRSAVTKPPARKRPAARERGKGTGKRKTEADDDDGYDSLFDDGPLQRGLTSPLEVKRLRMRPSHDSGCKRELEEESESDSDVSHGSSYTRLRSGHRIPSF